MENTSEEPVQGKGRPPDPAIKRALDRMDKSAKWLSKKVDNARESRMVRIGLWVFLILFLNPLLLYLGVIGTIHISMSIASMGIGTFVSLLMLGYFVHECQLKPGDMRRAMAGSFTVTYCVLVAVVAFSNFGGSGERVKWVLDSFTTLFGVVVAFYFGTRTIERLIESRRSEPPPQQAPQPQ